jgi:uncharacterized membrane protein YfcA
MLYLGYTAFFLMGGAFGLIGAGGSILSVPILIYIFDISPIIATSYSFYIVGLVALFGAIGYFKKKLISFNDVMYFSIPSTLGVIFSRYFILPSIPNILFGIDRNTLIATMFSILMILSGILTFRKRENLTLSKNEKSLFLSSLYALIIGSIVGLLGAGGGFLIIPALYNLLKVDIKKSIGTSLAIVSLNCFIAIIIDSTSENVIRNEVMIPIIISSIFGMFFGLKLESNIKTKNIKTIFATLVIMLGLTILIKQLNII